MKNRLNTIARLSDERPEVFAVGLVVVIVLLLVVAVVMMVTGASDFGPLLFSPFGNGEYFQQIHRGGGLFPIFS